MLSNRHATLLQNCASQQPSEQLIQRPESTGGGASIRATRYTTYDARTVNGSIIDASWAAAIGLESMSLHFDGVLM